ncbi:uncharacterized protein LOC136034762 [Artemia franciscana]|uniref:uncharacterized protein LOC136034762 n=1 Tax=Artemia franciscana TaxID=6661 RepID=UPI0032DB7A52
MKVASILIALCASIVLLQGCFGYIEGPRNHTEFGKARTYLSRLYTKKLESTDDGLSVSDEAYDDESETEESGEIEHIINPFIVGGDETEITRYPFIVSIQFRKKHQCAGIIIDRSVILTAAHCITDILTTSKNWVVVAGKTYLKDTEPGQVLSIFLAEQHPDYMYTKSLMLNDIGMIWLNGSFVWSENVQPATLPRNWEYAKDIMITVVGWGRTKIRGSNSNKLRRVSLPIRGEKYCLRTLRAPDAKSKYTITMFCTREKGKDSCNGDSGGPLVHGNIVVGIVSHGLGLCGRTAAWNVKVTVFYDWIQQRLDKGYNPSRGAHRSPTEISSGIDPRKASLINLPYEPYIFLNELHEVKEGDSIDIICTVLSSTRTITHWTKVNDPEFLEEGTRLKLSNIKVSDKGNYTCHSYTVLNGQELFVSTSTQIVVKYRPGTAIIAPESVVDLIGSNLKLICSSNPTGYPLPVFKWKKIGNNEVILESNEMQFKSLQLVDSGTYSCRAENEIGSGAPSFIKVRVIQPLQLIQSLANTIERKVSETEFSMGCAAAGNTKTAINWLKDEVLIPQHSEIYKLNTDEYNIGDETVIYTSTLLFKGVNRTNGNKLESFDSGVYSCIFESKYDRIESKTLLKISELEKTKSVTFHDFCLRKDGTKLYSHPTRCDTFVQCVHGRPFTIECGKGTAFSDILQLCTWPQQAGCQRYNKDSDTTEGPDTNLQLTHLTSGFQSRSSKSVKSYFLGSSHCDIPTKFPQMNHSEVRFGEQWHSWQEYIGDWNMNFKVKLKIEGPDGVIFYSRHPENYAYLALYLKDGHLRFSVANHETIHLEVPFNYYEEWVTISFTATEDTGILKINDYHVAKAHLNLIKLIFKSENQGKSRIFLGGVPPNQTDQLEYELEGVTTSFKGCVERLFIGEQPIDQLVYSRGVHFCQLRLEDGIHFTSSSGFLSLDEAVYDEDIIVISFDIRLSVETSTILSLFNSAVSLNLMTLNGTIIFDFKSEYERSTTSFVSTREHHICDGSWHRIKAMKIKNMLILAVDNKFAESAMITEKKIHLHMVSSLDLWIGGNNKTRNTKESSSKFIGCLKNLYINQKRREFSEMKPVGKKPSNQCPFN